jgi:hypothetical protein
MVEHAICDASKSWAKENAECEIRYPGFTGQAGIFGDNH